MTGISHSFLAAMRACVHLEGENPPAAIWLVYGSRSLADISAVLDATITFSEAFARFLR